MKTLYYFLKAVYNEFECNFYYWKLHLDRDGKHFQWLSNPDEVFWGDLLGNYEDVHSLYFFLYRNLDFDDLIILGLREEEDYSWN